MSSIGKAGGPIERPGAEVEGVAAQAAAEAEAAENGAGAAAPARGSAVVGRPAIAGALLQRSLERSLGGARPRAASLPSGRDVLHGAAVLEAERRRDPAAGDRFLAGGRHDQAALLADCRSAARALGLKVERQGSAAAASRGGAASATASGTARLDADGFAATGQARARAGISGSKSGSARGALGSAWGRAAGAAEVHAQASGQVKADGSGLRARGEAEVGVRAQVTLDGQFATRGVRIGGQTLDVNGKIHGEAEVSAYARADADVAATMSPPRVVVVANAKAFAGAKAAAHGSLGLGDFVRVSGSVEAWAGAGAEAGIQAGYDDGKLRLGFNMGAAVGYGAGYSFAIEIDVKKIAMALGNALTGGRLSLSVLFDRGDGEVPIELAQIELLFPPVMSSTADAFEVEVDLEKDRVRLDDRKRERAAAENHIRAVVRERLSARPAGRP